MQRRLKAADPTMVEGPRAPASKFKAMVSMSAKRISGAELPSAINVRFATVSFQTKTLMDYSLIFNSFS